MNITLAVYKIKIFTISMWSPKAKTMIKAKLVKYLVAIFRKHNYVVVSFF